MVCSCNIIEERDICHLAPPENWWKEHWRERKNESLKWYICTYRWAHGSLIYGEMRYLVAMKGYDKYSCASYTEICRQLD